MVGNLIWPINIKTDAGVLFIPVCHQNCFHHNNSIPLLSNNLSFSSPIYKFDHCNKIFTKEKTLHSFFKVNSSKYCTEEDLLSRKHVVRSILLDNIAIPSQVVGAWSFFFFTAHCLTPDSVLSLQTSLFITIAVRSCQEEKI